MLTLIFIGHSLTMLLESRHRNNFYASSMENKILKTPKVELA